MTTKHMLLTTGLYLSIHILNYTFYRRHKYKQHYG